MKETGNQVGCLSGIPIWTGCPGSSRNLAKSPPAGLSLLPPRSYPPPFFSDIDLKICAGQNSSVLRQVSGSQIISYRSIREDLPAHLELDRKPPGHLAKKRRSPPTFHFSIFS